MRFLKKNNKKGVRMTIDQLKERLEKLAEDYNKVKAQADEATVVAHKIKGAIELTQADIAEAEKEAEQKDDKKKDK